MWWNNPGGFLVTLSSPSPVTTLHYTVDNENLSKLQITILHISKFSAFCHQKFMKAGKGKTTATHVTVQN